jgi:hypothetical protein
LIECELNEKTNKQNNEQTRATGKPAWFNLTKGLQSDKSREFGGEILITVQ